MEQHYIFQSNRLGFRNWQAADIPQLHQINTTPKVMEFFPGLATLEQTEELIQRMQKIFDEKGYCYFAVDELETGNFIGFIGLGEALFESSFTPCTDIGWRLSERYWGNGYATEGAQRCLVYAFEVLGLKSIKAIAPAVNVKSIQVMEKIGMHHELNFKHPKLLNEPRLVDCVCYEINEEKYLLQRSE